jgi:hypothetical protein
MNIFILATQTTWTRAQCIMIVIGYETLCICLRRCLNVRDFSCQNRRVRCRNYRSINLRLLLNKPYLLLQLLLYWIAISSLTRNTCSAALCQLWLLWHHSKCGLQSLLSICVDGIANHDHLLLFFQEKLVIAKSFLLKLHVFLKLMV